MTASPSDLLQEGLALHRGGAVAEAASRYAAVLRLEPENADAHYYLAVISCQQGRFAEGAEHSRQSLVSDPQQTRAHVLLGRALAALGRREEEALSCFDRAIALTPGLAQAHGHRADLLSELGRNAEAVESYDRALALAPEMVDDWFNRGAALVELGRHAEAVASFERAIAGKPEFIQAHLRRAKALTDLDRQDEALAALERVLAIEPGLAEAWLGRGNVLTELKRREEALSAFERALALKPDLAEAWLGRGNVLTELKQSDDAFAAYDRALALKTDFAEAWVGRGNVLTGLRRYDDAWAAYGTALELNPNLAAAWFARGNLLRALKRLDDALAAYDRALALKPDFAEVCLGRANVLLDAQRYEDAIAAYDKAFSLKPDLNYAAGLRLYAKLLICSWVNLEEEVAELLTAIGQRRLSSTPFAVLTLPSSARDQLNCARNDLRERPVFPHIWRGETYSHDRIRIAYLSADFHEHPTMHLAAGLFENHDKSRFKITGISLGRDRGSPMRRRIERSFEHFIDVAQKSDQEIADLVREHEIDIAVDLTGFTLNNRFQVLARRPAPIQVNYLGYIGTMGADVVDYVIGDRIALPFDQQVFFTEKIVHLPDCFLPTDNRQEIALWAPSREEVGLPPEGFVFCSFNNSYKFGRRVFEAWMRLLRAVPGSVLWLTQANDDMVANLRQQAQQLGVAPERIVFALHLPLPRHLARQRLAGLFLDTLPYNAGATGAAALWSGVPLVTVMGETFVGRMAASMLHAVGLPELAARNLDEYEALALKLATNPDLLSSLRVKLKQNLRTMPLFDTDRFRRHLEQAYQIMINIHRRGEGPRSFSVESA